MKKNILFLCTGNSCRSQMAEGWAKSFHAERANFYSAGLQKHGLNPWAVKTMGLNNIDISSHTSNTLDEYSDITFDLVITVCGHADETCPTWPSNTQVIHKAFEDPPKLAQGLKKDEEILIIYEKVCTEIKEFIKALNF